MHYEGFLLQATPLSITLGASHPCANHYLHNLGTGVVCLLFWVLTEQGLFKFELISPIQVVRGAERSMRQWPSMGGWPPSTYLRDFALLPFCLFARLPVCPFALLPFCLLALLPFALLPSCLFAILPFSRLPCPPVCSFSPSAVPFHWPIWEISCWLNCTTTNSNSNLSWC